jgi:hypothetical protein
MQGYFLEDPEQWSQHAVQSIVWSAAGETYRRTFFAAYVDAEIGCEKLAVIEENIITAFNEVGGDNNNVVTMTLNRAYRVGVVAL